MHNVNKRTLHYYDNIGLFSPCTKGENIMEMKLREYQEQDFNELVNIVRETWQYDKFCNSKTANNFTDTCVSTSGINYK